MRPSKTPHWLIWFVGALATGFAITTVWFAQSLLASPPLGQTALALASAVIAPYFLGYTILTLSGYEVVME